MAGRGLGPRAAFGYTPSGCGIDWTSPLGPPGDEAFESAVRSPDVQRALDECLASGEPVSVLTHVRTANGWLACVVVAGVYGQGTAPTVGGHVVDVTSEWQQDVSEHINVQVQTTLTARSKIDQAKGVLMHLYGIDADEAFSTLARCSQNTNVKVRDLADRLLQAGGSQSVGNTACANPVLSLLERYLPAERGDQPVTLERAVGL